MDMYPVVWFVKASLPNITGRAEDNVTIQCRRADLSGIDRVFEYRYKVEELNSQPRNPTTSIFEGPMWYLIIYVANITVSMTNTQTLMNTGTLRTYANDTQLDRCCLLERLTS